MRSLNAFQWLLKMMVVVFLVGSSEMYAAATYTSGSTAAQLAAMLQGPGITITNPVLKRGNSAQAGIFSNGSAGANLEIDQGILLTTMSVAEAFTTNSSWRTSIDNTDITADTDLLKIDTKAKYDTVVLEFDVTLGANTKLLMVDYQFASEEYNEYVGSQFNDAFGFFVSGGDLNQTYNIARVVDDSTIITTQNIVNYSPVTVNNVNNGSVGIYNDTTPENLTNSQYFINNCVKGSDVPNCTQSQAPVSVEFDGLTHRLHATLDNLTPGVTYHFKMALADAGDSQWDTGVFVNKIMGIRGPQFCYDYAYKQNNRYITNKSYVGKTPRIDSYVVPGSDVDVSLYIKNVETSELTAQNIKMNINDINSSQAIYSANTVGVVYPNQTVTTPIADNTSGMSTANTYVQNIPIGSVAANEYYYLYYGLKPSVYDLNISLDATLSFNLNVQGAIIPYTYKLGSDKIPMCTTTTTYLPSYGIFNVVESELYSGGGKYNNLRTQVANRVGKFKAVAFEPTNFNAEKTVSTIAAVELIDAGAYYDANASCMEPKSAISPRIWLKWNNSSQVDLDRASINAAISDQRTTLSAPEEFFNQARENTAFRISYLTTNDGNNDLVRTSPGSPPSNTKIDNFTALVQNIGQCKQEVRINQSTSNMTNQVAVACGNAGNQGINGWELHRCMECLYGYNTNYICSRDNFATRPEALSVQMYNLNQLNTTQKVPLPTVTGVMAATSADMNLSAGSVYGYDINATNYVDQTATPGYTRYFGTNDSDYNVSFVWSPKATATQCNDTTDKTISFNIIDGQAVDQLGSHNQAGTYKLHLEDRKWTAVDYLDISHHNNANFLSGSDCVLNSNAVVPEEIDTGNGCIVNSGGLINVNGVRYQDHNLTFKPHHFSFQDLHISRGTTYQDVVTGNNIWSYMSTINTDANMSVRYFGKIRAQGQTNTTLSNFVDNCYAEPINLDFNLTFPIAANLPDWRYKLDEINATSSIWRNSTAVLAAPATTPVYHVVTLPKSAFLNDQNGLIDMNLSLNFDRNESRPVNPITVGLNNLQVKCQNAADCRSSVDMVSNHLPDANMTTDTNVTFVYGRIIPRDVRVFGTVPFEATGWYEVFNAPILAGTTLPLSRNENMWYANTLHNDQNDGDAAVTYVLSSGSLPDPYTSTYLKGTETYRFNASYGIGTYKGHIRTNPWLWNGVNVSPYSSPSGTNSNCLTHPCFNISIAPVMGTSGSAKSDATSTKGSKSTTQSGSTGSWKSSSDYAPAIR